MNQPTELRRELGLYGAVITGLGSILGTGVFVSIGIAAGPAGDQLVLAIMLAAIVATCNGLSSAQLAANHPVSGGTYEYGYHWLFPAAGFTAGWMFLCAKSASAATAALGFAGYLLQTTGGDQSRWLIPVAILATAVLTVVTLLGMKRTAIVNAAIVSLTIFALTVFGVAGLMVPIDDTVSQPSPAGMIFHWEHLAQATALMFVAYTGYGRIATLGEEVKDPRRTIPRAVVLTLIVSMMLYCLVGWAGLRVVGAERFAELAQTTSAPLEGIAAQMNVPGVRIFMVLGAMTAMLGVLLNLLLGLSRIVLAMARRGDAPSGFARIDSQSGVPWAATILVGGIIAGIACIGSVKLAWSFSAFTVLVYYAITNLCALRLTREQRMFPRVVAVMGLISCLGLAFWVEREIWLTGCGLLIAGLLWHFAARSLRR